MGFAAACWLVDAAVGVVAQRFEEKSTGGHNTERVDCTHRAYAAVRARVCE
jgi:hypothetical protein